MRLATGSLRRSSAACSSTASRGSKGWLPRRSALVIFFRRSAANSAGVASALSLPRNADLIGPVLGLPFSGLSLRGVSCIAEIILVMRYVELRSQLHRMISVVKVRDAEIDCALHRFSISGNGIVIEPDSMAAEEILAQVVQHGGHRGPVRTSTTGHGSED